MALPGFGRGSAFVLTINLAPPSFTHDLGSGTLRNATNRRPVVTYIES